MGLIYRMERLLSAARRFRETRARGPLGEFHRAGGASLLVTDLPLGSDDLAIDGGGYIGEWTDAMLCRYGCQMVVFEPVPAFARALSMRYERNVRVEVQPVALASRNGQALITVDGESSSLVAARNQPGTQSVRLTDFAEYLLARDWVDVGCLMLNVEGAEYEVLDRLLQRGLARRFRCLLIQFHRIAPEAESRRRAIQTQLDATHRKIYDFPFVWERWDRRSS